MPRVMIVDDDRTTTNLLETLLMLDGFEVTQVARGSDVMALAERDLPEIFLIDYHLSDMNGPEVVLGLRADERFAECPIVIASGMNVENEARAAGATMFLIKPLDPSTLANTLANLLEPPEPQINTDQTDSET